MTYSVRLNAPVNNITYRNKYEASCYYHAL